MQMNIGLSLSLYGLLLLSTGCVCVPGNGFDMGPVAYRQSACDSCSSCSSGPSTTSGSGFYSGPGPLASFFGLTSCNGGGCGELYVDEWLNEPPKVDQCGYTECLQCGRSPIRALVQTLVGRQYTGSCDTCQCDDHGVLANGAIVHDGYETGAWSSHRGCNCSASPGSTQHMGSYSFGNDSGTTTIQSVDPSGETGSSILNGSAPERIQALPDSSGTNGRSVKPTPAPALPPSSASRLNPAVRRIVR